MTPILIQLSIAIGGVIFVVVLMLTIPRGVPLLTAVFRATMVMCASSVTVALFLRFFTALLHRFVAEQILKQKHDENKQKVRADPARKESKI